MPLFTLRPDGAYQASTAILAGDLTLGAGSSFWFASMARGDLAPIVVGRRTNVQDGAMLHCDAGVPLTIEEDVSIGHGAVVHGAFVGAALIGMSSTILTRARIGAEAIVAAGAVVPPDMVVPARMLVMGVPAKVVRAVTDEEVADTLRNAQHYLELAMAYARGEL